MKLNNLRIIFSALLLSITWQSEALAGGGTVKSVTDRTKLQDNEKPRAAAQVGEETGQVDSGTKRMVQETVDALKFGNTCPAPDTSGPALSAEESAQLNAHFSAMNNIVKQLEGTLGNLPDSEFLAVINGLYQTPGEKYSVRETIQGYDSEARGGTLPMLEIFRSNMLEKSQDNDGNGKIDLFDLWEQVKKENPNFTFAQRKAEFFARLALTIEQRRAFGISEKLYQEFKENDCLGALIP